MNIQSLMGIDVIAALFEHGYQQERSYEVTQAP